MLVPYILLECLLLCAICVIICLAALCVYAILSFIMFSQVETHFPSWTNKVQVYIYFSDGIDDSLDILIFSWIAWDKQSMAISPNNHFFQIAL